jgi:hypothetical protein
MTTSDVVYPINGKIEELPSHGGIEAADVLAENPCLTRFRHKRLLAFLRGQRYDGAFNA